MSSDSSDKKSVKGQIGKITRQTAKQIAEESGEVLKDAGEQVTGVKKESPPDNVGREIYTSEKGEVSEEKKSKIQSKNKRVIKALENELEDIRKSRVYAETQRKIQQGKDVNLSAVEGLTKKQREALEQMKKGMEEAKAREAQKEGRPISEPSTKKKRGLIGQAKKKVDDVKRKVEILKPPSG